MNQRQANDSTSASLRLDDRVAVVTGASSGIGRAIALEMASAGADVIVHFRNNASGAEKVVEDIRKLDCHAIALQCDLADMAQHDRFADEAWNWRSGVDVWVNNAGADVLTGSAANLAFEEKLELLWHVDVLATMRLSREIGRRMGAARREQQYRAVILNMGWDQADHGMSGESGEMFAAIKGAVMAFSKSLAKTLAPRVRVNCLAPGWIKTSWGEQASDFWHDIAVKQSLLQRWGTPDDVARVARFLASPAADFITGQVVPINGGFSGGGPS